MTRIAISIVLTIIVSFCMVSVNAATEGTDFSSIEAQERAQIISELTFHLKTKQVCAQKLVWDDSGSGADLDGYFFNPVIGNNEYMIGGHASQKRRSKYHCVTVVSLPVSNPKDAPPLLVSPVEWKQVWKDSGSGATKDGSFWQAIPPDNNYKCIGNVSQLGHSQKPNIHNYRCVHKSLTDKIVINNMIWSDKGSGADRQVTIFSLPATGAYTAVPSRVNSVETYDLKKNATSVPDEKIVEEILGKRIAPLKADIEEKARAIQEQNEVKKNAAAKKAKQEKTTAVKEKKRHAKAKQKALAEQTHTETEKKDNIKENKKALEEAEHLKKEQQARIAKAKEEKAAAELEKQKIARQEKESVSELERLRKEEAESEAVVEELVKAQPEKIKTVESGSDSFSASESGKESKGLNDILMFFVKVFGIMVGGVIVFIMAFKVLFSKKAAKK